MTSPVPAPAPLTTPEHDVRVTAYRYRIRSWDEHFETATTRKLRRPQWVSVPTRQSGIGFTRIMCQEDGAAIFGIWILIVQACAALPAPRAGWLTDDGTAAGVPWTIDDLVEKWRRRPSEVARALDVLCSPKVGWIEAIDDGGRLVGDSPTVEVEVEVKERRGGACATAQPEPAPHAIEKPPEDHRDENRRLVRGRLARLRFACDDVSIEEWMGLLSIDAQCPTIAEALDCLNWIKSVGRKEGVTSRYAKYFEGLALRWHTKMHRKTPSNGDAA